MITNDEVELRLKTLGIQEDDTEGKVGITKNNTNEREREREREKR